MAHKHLNAKLQLEAARAQGRIFFRRVTGPLFAGAASLMLLGVTLEALLAVACEGSLGLSKVDCKYARSMPSVLMMLAAPLVMLIVLPTQNRFIWLLNAIQTPGGFVVSLYFGFEIRGALAKQRFAQGECVSFDLDEPTPCECLMSTLVVLSTFALVCVNTSAAFVALLLRRGLSSRRRLDGIWRIMRTAYVTAGSVSLIALVAELVRGHCSETDVFRRVLLWGQTLIALLIGALLSMPNVRARTHAFLSVRSEAAAAASGIASVLSGRPIDELASNAARLFRAIRLDLVRYEDLVDATIDPKLESRAQPRDLLDCDAFISHSWSDPPAEKWIALQLWRRQFIADHGREPVVFIDKFCISQRDESTVAAALECLPLWIAGCQQFVVLFGGSYLSRMWCLMELHTHLEMGGPIEHIILLRVGDGPSVAARPVNIAASQCRDPADFEMMLAVVEASTGGARAFNTRLEALLASLDVPSAPSMPVSSSSSLVIITDAQPDDVKALLVASALHAQGGVTLRAVVANGGRARERARLTRCLLDHVGATDVPVGVGSDGAAAVTSPRHEYALPGCAAVADERLRAGGPLLLEVLSRAADLSVAVVCLSGLRDFAQLCAANPALVRRKVHTVAVQGGLIADLTTPSGWAPDTSQNNEFDREAAACVYAFCFEHGLPMTVTSRHAVPMIPMQLARSFAERTECPVMRYLADAQVLGLKGLWQKLCEGELPARCTKQWYFETFCSVEDSALARRGFKQLDGTSDIVPHLDGVIKPYDVVALMTVLPHARHLFPGRAVFMHHGAAHLLLLQPSEAPPAAPVVTLLRDAYHEVVRATARTSAVAAARRSRRDDGVCGPLVAVGHAAAALLGCEPALARRHTSVSSASSLAGAPPDVGSPPRRASAGRGGVHAASEGRLARMRSDEAVRTDVRAVLLAHQHEYPRTKVAPDELQALLTTALETLTARRKQLIAATLLFAGTWYSLVIGIMYAHQLADRPLPRGAVNLATEYGAAIAMGHIGQIGLLASVGLRPGARVALLVAAYILIATLFGVVGDVLVFWHASEIARALLDDAAASLAAGGDARAAGRVIGQVSYMVMSLSLLNGTVRALGALGWAAYARPGRPPPRALGGAALVTALWRTSALFSLWLVLLPCWRASSTLGVHSLEDYQLDGLCAVLHCGGFVLCVSPAARQRLERVASRPFGSRGAIASLGPLLSFGSASRPTPAALVASAQNLFRTVTLGVGARAALALPPRAETTADQIAADALNFKSELVFDPAAPERRSARGALWAAHAQRADAFVWSIRGDEYDAFTELCAWAERFEAREGRPPTVWVRELCADLSLTATELLAQLPCLFTLCDAFLLLSSPRTPLDLHAVIAVHTWRTLGGSVDSIEVALVAGAAEREATVGAFEGFHVARAAADELPAADGGNEADHAEVVERLELCAMLALPQTLNSAMRELLPAVHRAAAAAAAADGIACAAAPTRARLLSWGMGCGGGGAQRGGHVVARDAAPAATSARMLL